MKKEGNYMLLHDGFDFSEDFTIEARMRKEPRVMTIRSGLAWCGLI